jgi:hypothetical protein
MASTPFAFRRERKPSAPVLLFEENGGLQPCFAFRRERRASALRKIQQIQGALAPGLLFVEPQSSFFRSLFSR